MRKLAMIVCLTAIMVSCKENKKTATSDSDSAEVMQMVNEVVESSNEPIYLSKDSIGTLAVGMETNDLPAVVDGLYDSSVPGTTTDALTIHFHRGDVDEFVAYDFGEGRIDVIEAVGPDVKVKTNAGDLELGDSFVKVLELPGVQTEWTGYDDGGMWYWVWEGIWFAPVQDTLPEGLSKLLYNSSKAPEKSDFTENIKIDFIGTGLPF